MELLICRTISFLKVTNSSTAQVTCSLACVRDKADTNIGPRLLSSLLYFFCSIQPYFSHNRGPQTLSFNCLVSTVQNDVSLWTVFGLVRTRFGPRNRVSHCCVVLRTYRNCCFDLHYSHGQKTLKCSQLIHTLFAMWRMDSFSTFTWVPSM